MTAINTDQTTTLVANKANEQYIINAKLQTPGLAIDASAAVTGRSFVVNGTVSAGAGTAMTLGVASLADSKTSVKIADVGTFTSAGNGLVAYSGGVTFENAGSFTADATAVQFLGSHNVFTNTTNATVNSPGKLSSTNGSALVTAGAYDAIENTGGGVITALRTAIVSSGNHTSITNTGTAQIQSTAGSAIVASGSWDTIYSVSQMHAEKDVIVSTGNKTKITNAGDSSLSSDNGRGIVSKGDDVTITNDATISTKSDAIFSSGDNATIRNSATLGSWNGVGIRSTGDGAQISNTTTVQAKSYGIYSTGDDAVINNLGTINAGSTGIVVAGDDAVVSTTSQIAARVAIKISGDGAHVTNENEISGSGKHTATIEITATGHTTITNHGAVSASGSGTVINAGNGSETIVNTSSLYGVVNLGGGNDVFKSSVTGVVSGAVNAGAGNDRITNAGLLEYDVNLGAGNDVFTALTGEVRGKVIGGKGNDLYILGTDPHIVEAKGGGIDTVQSKFTYTLGANIENLQLIGKKTMDATGNNLANRIEGNAGNNHLTGLGGKDVFVFETGFKHDIITDFTDQKDHIDLSGYQGIDKFSDLAGKIVQSGHDVVITFDSHDQLTIQNTHKSELSAADFIF